MLEAVCSEVLEPKNVENAKELRGLLTRVDACVDMIDEPREGPRVQCLGHRVSILVRLADLQRNLRDVAADIDLSLQRHLPDVFWLQAKKLRHFGNDFFVLDGQLALFTVDIFECQVAEPN